MGIRRRETLDIPATPSNLKYASRLRAEVLNAIERGTFDYARFFPSSRFAKINAPATVKRYKVGELLDAFLARARKSGAISPSTLASYARWDKARLHPQWGETWLDELGTQALRTWIAELAGEMAPKSVRNCVGLLSVVLAEATTDGLIPANPLAPISLKTLLPKRRTTAERDKIDPFNGNEIAAILSTCPSVEERSLIQFAFGTGLRVGELIGLKWENIDWLGRSIHVENNVVSAEYGTVEKGTKTDGSMRDVPLIPSALASLEAMRPISQLRSPYVFTNPRTGQRWLDEQSYRSRWTKILRDAKVRYRNPYQTRHTFASTLLMNGEPELLVARLLGHATVEMVRRNYGRYIRQDCGITLRGAYTELGAPLGQDATPKAALGLEAEKKKA